MRELEILKKEEGFMAVELIIVLFIVVLLPFIAVPEFLKISKKAVESEFVSMTSLNTWVYEKDIGNMCCYLISDESSRISGQVVGVDGNTLRMH